MCESILGVRLCFIGGAERSRTRVARGARLARRPVIPERVAMQISGHENHASYIQLTNCPGLRLSVPHVGRRNILLKGSGSE